MLNKPHLKPSATESRENIRRRGDETFGEGIKREFQVFGLAGRKKIAQLFRYFPDGAVFGDFLECFECGDGVFFLVQFGTGGGGDGFVFLDGDGFAGLFRGEALDFCVVALPEVGEFADEE